jgi:hypothetical protein
MPFTLDPKGDTSHTSWADDFEVAPAAVVRAFGGPPRRGDAYKISGLYPFVGDDRVFTLYDWKSTSLWDQDLPSALAFWNCRSTEVLSIGSDADDIAEFRSWLLRRLHTASL